MSNLMKMNLYRMVRMKKLWIFSGIICLACFLIPILGILFTNLLYSMAESMQDPELLMETELIMEQMKAPVNVSNMFMAPYGGLSIMLIFVMVSAASFHYASFSRGYIKNLAGQLPSRGQFIVSEYLTIGIHDFIMLFFGLVGSFFGYLVTHELVFDELIPIGLLVFVTKVLLMWSMTTIVFLFSTGLRNQTLAIVSGVVIGSGSLQIVYLALNFGLSKLVQKDVDVGKFIPDQLFSKIFLSKQEIYEYFPYAVLSSLTIMAIFLFGTYYLFRKRDIK